MQCLVTYGSDIWRETNSTKFLAFQLTTCLNNNFSVRLLRSQNQSSILYRNNLPKTCRRNLIRYTTHKKSSLGVQLQAH